jgi:hypothetical protein
MQDPWTVYLAGDSHSDRREEIRVGIRDARLAVDLVGP